MATHSSILAWRIPRTAECGALQCMGFQGQTCRETNTTFIFSLTTKILKQITIHDKCHCVFMLYFLNSLLISNCKIVTS